MDIRHVQCGLHDHIYRYRKTTIQGSCRGRYYKKVGQSQLGVFKYIETFFVSKLYCV